MDLLVLCLLSVVGLVGCGNTYITTVPRQIRPGEEAIVCITALISVRKPILVNLRLMDKNNRVIQSTIAVKFYRYRPVTVRVKVPLTIKYNSDYRIRVKATGGLHFDKTVTRISVSWKASSIFIQTDKAAYKPGDLVQYRVLGTDSKLKVLNDAMDIYIADPKGNRVQQSLKVQPAYGVYIGSFQLSTLTNLGNWKINVKQGRTKLDKKFSVERYVLPRFDVSVIMPSFQLITETFFRVKISAKYTFGKPVKGTCNLTIQKPWTTSGAINKRFKINGLASVKVLMSDVFKLGYNIRVTAVVTEGITGISANDTSKTILYRTPELLKFSSSMPRIFKPRLTYTIILRVTKRDESPLEPPLGKIKLTVKYYEKLKSNILNEKGTKISTGEKGERGPDGSIGALGPRIDIGWRPQPRLNESILLTKYVQIPSNGIIKEAVEFPLSAERATVQASYRKGNAYRYLSRARSPSNSYLQVSIVNSRKPTPNRYLILNIRTTESNVRYAFYKVISKGSIVTKGRFRLYRRSSIVRLKIKYTMAPSAKLLLYYTRRSGEIVADAITILVDDIFKNRVGIMFNKRKALPGDKVRLDIQAGANSMVCVLAVDKSVLLFRGGNDITVQDVMKELLQYDTSMHVPIFRRWDFWYPRSFSGIDAYSVFYLFGVYVLTDANLYKYRPPPRHLLPPTRFGGEEHGMAGQDGGSAPDMAFIDQNTPINPDLVTPTRTRKHFPETWLWKNAFTGLSGRTQISSIAPDTITEWVTSAFAVSPTTGLGVASEFANLTTFQRFFMRFDLPYSAIRGEQIIVQISVFNYLAKEQRVVVTLSNSVDFIFVDYNGNALPTGSNGISKTIIVKKNSVGAVYIPIEATAIGKIKLHATARCEAAADAVEKDFLIEAEGIKQSYNMPLIIDLKTTSIFTAVIDIDFPPNLVGDSEFIKLQVIGDLLGSTLNGIEDLLRMSYGCGEQNMIGFVANVYVSTYLKATERLNPDLEAKAKKVIAAGYQRQLTYAHNDGSYSAFGNNDKSGSTWLTAYVIKSFSQASKFVYIDKDHVMKRALVWITKQQEHNGTFDEPGKVLHKAMQGGSVSSKRSLASFVLIALEEAKRNNQVSKSVRNQYIKILSSVNLAILKAAKFIAHDAPASIGNLYELAISLYALSLVNHSKKDELLIDLENKAKTDGGGKYWKLTGPVAQKVQPWRRWNPPRTNARAIDVEMTSYVLLGYNIKGDTLNGIKVLRWLGNQRNPRGGFISTQDTVIALQALSGLGVKLYVKTFSMTVKTKGDIWSGKAFKINDKNALVLQSEDLPKSVRSISISAHGTGLCLLEVAVYYNVYDELRIPAFDLIPTVLKETINGFTLKVCFRWKRGGESTMSLLEINIPSGMEADTDSVDASEAHGQYTTIEKAFRKVNLFFDAILSIQMCIRIDIRRTSMVARHKPQSIRLSEYYEPSNEVIKTYISNKLANATIIEVCGPDNCQEVKRR